MDQTHLNYDEYDVTTEDTIRVYDAEDFPTEPTYRTFTRGTDTPLYEGQSLAQAAESLDVATEIVETALMGNPVHFVDGKAVI